MSHPPVVDVWWADLRAADLTLLAALPEAEQHRLRAIEGESDRGRSLVAAALLQHAVAAHRSDPAPVAVDRTCAECGQQHGRPVVAGGPHVSVSHAGVLIVVATFAPSPVGIDVERLDRDLPEGVDAASWTAREAELKAGSGRGELLIPLSPPLPGYAATLAISPLPVLREDAAALVTSDPRGVTVREHHWPEPG